MNEYEGEINLKQIKVTYDGCYPNMCGGRLIVKFDEVEVYNNKYCCDATRGALCWEDEEKYDLDIRKAVESVLSEYQGCCGGCY